MRETTFCTKRVIKIVKYILEEETVCYASSASYEHKILGEKLERILEDM